MNGVHFVVPGLPIPKARPRIGHGRAYTPQRTRQHERLIWVAAKQAHVRPLDGPVALTARFYLADVYSADVDNLLKTVQDALNGTAYEDDRQIVRAVGLKLEDPMSLRTEIEVGPA